MTSVPLLNSTASLVLQLTRSPAGGPQDKKDSADVAAIANGMAGISGPETQAQAKIAGMQSATSVTELRVRLYKRVGEELGVKQEDYATPQQWAAAMRQAVSVIRGQGNEGAAAILEIEQKLGLDKLGVSLDTVIDSISDPGGGASKALNDALKKAVAKGDIAAGGDDVGADGTVRLNEIGMYSVAGVRTLG